jgi:hypothetical protein
MSRPHKHRKSGVCYFRRAVPADLREAEGGKRELMFSLGTKDPKEALRLHLIQLAEVDARWRSLRDGQRDLTRREAAALAGEWYRWFFRWHQDEPGDDPDAYGHAIDALALCARLIGLIPRWMSLIADRLGCAVVSTSTSSPQLMSRTISVVGGWPSRTLVEQRF